MLTKRVWFRCGRNLLVQNDLTMSLGFQKPGV